MERGASRPRLGPGFLLSAQGWPYLLLPFIPLAIALDVANASEVAIFITAALGIVPTAALMGRATEELSARAGPGVGGLLNVTFGNAPELIIALFALGRGLHEVVKASLVGSILGNVLLVLGGAMLVGGWGRSKQTFSRTTASAQTSMLLLAAAAFAMPAIFELVDGGGLPPVGAEQIDFGSTVENLSLAVAVVLILTYLAGLYFSLRTHRDIFNPEYDHADAWGWSARRATAVLAISGVAVAVMSEVLVGSIEPAAHSLGLTEFFIGAIIVAIVGNAAEHWVAILVAHKNQMDLAVNISVGSSAQIALFVAPVLVICSFLIGPGPMPLVLNGFELGAVGLAVVIANYVTQEGESNWFEGVQLLAIYAIVVIAFVAA